MHHRKRAAILALGIIYLLLAAVSAALGEPAAQTGQAQVTTQPSQEDVIAGPSSDDDAKEDEEQPARTVRAVPETQRPASAAAEPKPAPKPAPPQDLTKADVQQLKQEHPGLISRIVSATRNIVTRAYSWLGTRYVWGGTSSRGVDCSGLTQLLMRAEEIHIPRTAKQQFQQGQSVARNSLLPGDLVFFNTRGPITHVGMYIGNRQFIHAANPRRGVRVDSIDSAYYANRYAGARRYKNLNHLALSG